MERFWELFRGSYILQGLLGVAFAGTIIYMYIASLEVPDALVNFTALILGFYFGSKTNGVIQARAAKKEE